MAVGISCVLGLMKTRNHVQCSDYVRETVLQGFPTLVETKVSVY